VNAKEPSSVADTRDRGSRGARRVRVGVVQMPAGDARDVNVERAVSGIREAAAQGAELICMQELFATPYFCQVESAELFDLAEAVDGPTNTAIARAAREAKVSVLSSFFERRAPGLYHNTALLFGPTGESLGMYRKMHIPDDPQYYEKFYFTPGDLGFVSLRAGQLSVGPLVCWDQWYPEAARLTALAGAELLMYPTAIGWLPQDKVPHGKDQLNAWQTMQRSHAIANGVFVVVANRVGVEKSGDPSRGDESIEFWGHSFICDPYGKVIAEAGEGASVLVADCDLGLIEQARRGWPFLRDRRIDAYGGLERRFGRPS
jgi:N-carbamoylputrescine amidase